MRRLLGRLLDSLWNRVVLAVWAYDVKKSGDQL